MIWYKDTLRLTASYNDIMIVTTSGECTETALSYGKIGG